MPPDLDHTTSINSFIGGTEKTKQPSELQLMTEAFLMILYFAKEREAVILFGMLLIKVFKTHQLTYNGERIIGWTVQYGK